MLSLEDAQQRILALVPPPAVERVALAVSLHRFLAENIPSPLDLPPFDNSAMDGYAVRAADTAGANAEHPRTLRLAGHVAAGGNFTGELQTGECIRIFTGSPMPRGADAVVMQEDTRIDPAKSDAVLVLDAVKPWENVRFHGEDVKSGAALASAGSRINVGRLSVLAAVGIAEVSVARRPVVGVLATGSELREPGQPLAAGQIYESNRAGISALLALAGAEPRVYPLVPDAPASTEAALRRAFDECDAVITSGGASVGEHDHVKTSFNALGGSLDFWRVAIKPGKPFVFGRWRGKFLFGLPGNPVSAFVTFLLLVRPALMRWQGAADVAMPSHPGTLAELLENRGDRRHFVRVTVDASGSVRSSGTQASHILSSLAEANGLVDVPPRSTLASGVMVKVMRWEL
ncbi:MAG: molybdopterin molybdotransferase MoeA [Verrucomicrobia bacterium]|nr:molybdopterin molybdotransferase MoeA [Verrucomicrobiota bacterium]